MLRSTSDLAINADLEMTRVGSRGEEYQGKSIKQAEYDSEAHLVQMEPVPRSLTNDEPEASI